MVYTSKDGTRMAVRRGRLSPGIISHAGKMMRGVDQMTDRAIRDSAIKGAFVMVAVVVLFGAAGTAAAGTAFG